MQEVSRGSIAYSRPARPYDGVLTRLRGLRRDIRGWVGVSSSPAPNLKTCLRASMAMATMVELASGGRYGLAIVHMDGAGSMRTAVSRSYILVEPVGDALARERELEELAQADIEVERQRQRTA